MIDRRGACGGPCLRCRCWGGDDLGVDDYHVAGYSLGARVGIHLAGSDRVRSVIAISRDGLGTPPERVGGYLALLAARAVDRR